MLWHEKILCFTQYEQLNALGSFFHLHQIYSNWQKKKKSQLGDWGIYFNKKKAIINLPVVLLPFASCSMVLLCNNVIS